MKISRIALSAAIVCSCVASTASAQQSKARMQPSAYSYGYYANEDSPSDTVATVSDQEPAPVVPGAPEKQKLTSSSNVPSSVLAPTACGCSNNPISGSCDVACAGGCDSACGCSDEPWKLFPCNPLGLNIGGWSAIGYHTANNNRTFNNYADRVQLQQQWLYAEKVADGSCGLDFGARIDYLYGTDAPDTQAFGIPNNHWDNSWDNGGAYGHAIPQLYGEVAYGDLSVKVGHFFTIIGNEVVQATGNFFYSRQYTFYNAEPFTHTGLLSQYKMDDDTVLWNGYVMGWDSGFEDNGDAHLSGFSRQLTDDVKVIYTSAVGRFNESINERGSVYSGILSLNMTDNLTYLTQMDYLDTENSAGATVRNTFGWIHYLIYKVSDKVSLGSRTEWFNATTGAALGAPIQNADIYNQTLGINLRASSNLLVRPEVRWVWDKESRGANEISPNDGLPLPSQAAFGTDVVFTF